MARRKKKNVGVKFLRYIVVVALGFAGIIGYSLIYTIESSTRFWIVIGLLGFVLLVFLIDIFTKYNIVTKADIKDLLPSRKR